MLCGNFAYLGTDLVTALTGLDVNDFSHFVLMCVCTRYKIKQVFLFWGRGSFSSILSCVLLQQSIFALMLLLESSKPTDFQIPSADRKSAKSFGWGERGRERGVACIELRERGQCMWNASSSFLRSFHHALLQSICLGSVK